MPAHDTKTDGAPYRVAYITSSERSGSTLLDQLLAAHPAVATVGEVHHLRAYALEDRRLYDPAQPLTCSCGEKLASCPFWTEVESSLGRQLATLKLKPVLFEFTGDQPDASLGRPLLGSTMKRLLHRWPAIYTHHSIHHLLKGHDVGADSFALLDAVHAVTEADVIIDSSKTLPRLWSLAARHPERMRVIVLVRDFRAVAYSQHKRGQDLVRSARSWARRIGQVEQMVAAVPALAVTWVRYEDLCSEPHPSLRRLCEFLGLEFDARMLARRSEGTHHIGGSPSKLDDSRRTVRLDDVYLRELSGEQMRAMERVAGDVGRRFGYPSC